MGNASYGQLGSKFDSAWVEAFSLICSFAAGHSGRFADNYLGGAHSLIFGVPVVIIGLALLIVVEFVIGKKSD